MTPVELYRQERAAALLRRAVRESPAPRAVRPPSKFASRAEYDRAYYRANRERKLAASNARYRALRVKQTSHSRSTDLTPSDTSGSVPLV